MRGKRAYWIGGTLTAFLGVGFVRVLAPALTGAASSLASITGYLLVIAGITIIAGATRRGVSNPIPRIGQDTHASEN